jgi:hypothetical protein
MRTAAQCVLRNAVHYVLLLIVICADYPTLAVKDHLPLGRLLTVQENFLG